MKVGDKVWTWDHWYKLIQIEINTIDNVDRTDVVNGIFLLSNLSPTKAGAEGKMKIFMRVQIKAKKTEIDYLEERLKRI